MMTRPWFREGFLRNQKQLEVYFYTSNLDKYLQARHLFERCGLALKYFKSRLDPYSEDYSRGKEALLSRAIEEVTRTVGSTSLFFVEDTSLRIDALSGRDEDYPGLRVKEWFAETSFEEVDRELLRLGNNRTAIVKSDIALHLPGLGRPLYFSGETAGVIARSPLRHEGTSQYPWLSALTFSGWFIPYGAERRLAEMSLDESLQYDFRAKALMATVDRLEEYAAALNLPTHAYVRVPALPPADQPELFPLRAPMLIVVGPLCAGKSTMGEHVGRNHGMKFVEASDIVRMLGREYPEFANDSYQLARKVLEDKGADIVAKSIMELFDREMGRGVVITGFRTIEEIEFITERAPFATIIRIDAGERIRYARNIKRGRKGAVNSLRDFRRVEEQQKEFGLLSVSADIAHMSIANEGSMREYKRKIDSVVKRLQRLVPESGGRKVSTRTAARRGQLFRCLEVLERSGKAVTCEEISRGTQGERKAILSNNVNKVLKKVPGLARRLEATGKVVRYVVSDGGRAYLRLLRETTPL